MAAEITPKPAASSNMARRSLSVFSRKGYDCPSPVGMHSLAVAGMTLAGPSTPSISQSTTTQPPSHCSPNKNSKKWSKLRRRSLQQHGTILRAVPQETPPPQMSSLEIEMATSPNEEILRNIGLAPDHSPSPVDGAIFFPQNPESPTNSRRMSVRQRRTTSQGNILGVWKDGSVEWNPQCQEEPTTPSLQDVTALTGPNQDGAMSNRTEKPKIQVVIPSGSKRRISLPSYLSPVKAKEPAPEEDPEHLQVPGHQRSASNASSSSMSSEEDKDSSSGVVSNRSSVTSIESDPESAFQATKPIEWKGKSSMSPEIDSAQTDASSAPSLFDLVDIVRTPSTRNPHVLTRACSGAVHKMNTLREGEEEAAARASSPTLSEAERSLEAHLTALQNVQQWKVDSIQREFSIARKPAPPLKSSKRRSRHQPIVIPSMEPPTPNRAAPATPTKQHTLRRSSSVRSCLSLVHEQSEQAVAANDAEQIVYGILSQMDDLDDLFNAAMMNKAFYRVFKNNELLLMQTCLRNMSAPAWEFRLTAQPFDEEPDSAIPPPEYSPATFYSQHVADSRVLGNIKSLILERCHSVIRPETEALLIQHSAFRKSEVDDALWRIWTFCKIFGCSKGREEDVPSHMDWLRGGIVAHQIDAQSSFSSCDGWFDVNSVLTTSEHFAMGNAGGLSAEELYNMTEMWNSLRLISQGILGQTEDARKYGVFDDTDIRGGDIDGEELMLEEWHNYLLTLGLSATHTIASPTTPEDAFDLANSASWTAWPAPAGGSTRANFLREPVARLYEERILESFAPAQSRAQEMRDLRRRRTSSLAMDLRERKASGSTQGLPLIAVEQPMSRANSVLDHLSTAPSSAVSAPPMWGAHPNVDISQYRQSMEMHVEASPVFSPIGTHPALRSVSVPNRGVWRPQSDVEAISLNDGLPGYEPEMQHPLQMALSGDDSSMHSPEKAIFRIVEMGFTHEEAKGALKITDMGDGLRVDRAVEYLLRTQGLSY
ncbi:hypothetical protein BT63DRAFT_442603 [Microthyrium microscopicum]|uniref:UBA domain-containing protein n=1 Tax=Microthyrium microscopicum TaxID=703497 RepID=A0A6A6U3Y5_9PEZI|nr:hypothetical protein BT63DRAFT_442603 [Microthyrium microscopicum]